jgi:hypothetical protein
MDQHDGCVGPALRFPQRHSKWAESRVVSVVPCELHSAKGKDWKMIGGGLCEFVAPIRTDAMISLLRCGYMEFRRWWTSIVDGCKLGGWSMHD